MIYTEDQWKIIKQASPHYETARHEYIRNAPRWLTEQIISVYEAATGKTVMHKDLSCAVCVLNIYKQVGKTYFDDLNNHQNNNFQDKLERENFADLENHQNNNFQDNVESENIDDLKEREDIKSEIKIETKDNDTRSETKKRNAESKTGNKKKKE